LNAFLEAARLNKPSASIWLRKLSLVDKNDFLSIVSRVPDSEMSGPAKTFTVKMLEENRKRLLSTIVEFE